MIDVVTKVKINGAIYSAAHLVITAIDAMATLLTGDRHYFAGEGGGATADQRRAAEERAAIERGEKSRDRVSNAKTKKRPTS